MGQSEVASNLALMIDSDGCEASKISAAKISKRDPWTRLSLTFTFFMNTSMDY